MMKRVKLWSGTWLVLITAVLAACAAPPAAVPNPCKKQVLTLDIYTNDQLNLTTESKPRPVVVRLYQLKTEMKMLNAPYNDILLDDSKLLGKDIIQMDEVQLFPEDLVRVQFERNPEATMLAGVALFRDPKGNSWKTYYEFPPMPDTPAACGASAGEQDAKAPQAFPKTQFFLSESKIDNGSQFDASMFSQSSPKRKINLHKASSFWH